MKKPIAYTNELKSSSVAGDGLMPPPSTNVRKFRTASVCLDSFALISYFTINSK